MSGSRLFWRLFLATAGASGVVVVALGAASWWHGSALIRSQVDTEIIGLAQGTARHDGERLAQLAHTVETLAANPLVVNALIDVGSGAQSYLVPLLAGQRLPFTGQHAIAFTDFAGKPVATNGQHPGAAALLAAQRAVERNRPETLLAPEGQPALIMAVPVVYPGTGTAEGAIVATVAIAELVAGHDVGLPAGTTASLLFGPSTHDDPSRLSARHGIDGPAAFAHLSPAVLITRDPAIAFAPLRQLQLWHTALALGGMLIAVLVAAVVSRRLAQRVESLAATTREIAQGRAGSAEIPDLGGDEVGQLATAMRGMLAEIERHRQHLEAEVQARTAALSASEAAARRLAIVAARTSNAVSISDAEGRLTWINDSFTRITGYRMEEVLGRKPASFLQGPETDRATVQRVREALLRREGVRCELLNYSKDGRRYWIEVDIQPILGEEGSLGGFIAVNSDITERKDNEARLQAATAAAQAGAQAKSAFLANMSHEIRTPMNGILGLAELLLAGKLDPEQADQARSLYRSAEALLVILNDILDFSKIEAGRLEFEAAPYDPEMLGLDVIDLLRSRVPQEVVLALRVDPAMPGRLLGDAGRLRQMLSNLVGNALKFTSRGHVLVDLAWLPSGAESGTLRVAVADTGIGIPADRLDRLFQPFSQADASTARRFGGTGLGLSISRRLAELMGGTVSVTSAVGTGSTFTIEVPQTSSTADGSSAGHIVQALSGRRLLVVANDAALRHSLADAVRATGAVVAEAASLDEACRALAGMDCTAVIADHALADGGAVALVNATSAIPVLSLFAAGHPPTEAPGRLAALLPRPLRRSQLAEAISLAIADRSAGHTRTLTRNDLSGGRLHDAPAPAAPRSGLRVLLVEDNPINQRVAMALLKRLGAVVTLAADGAEAVRMTDAATWDVVLMDCQMPVLDGFEATTQIRQREHREGRPRQPIVAMTANAMQGDRERCLACGMDDHVPKPITGDALSRTLSRWGG
jgi:PAS domain S-box-containing protein